MELVLSWYKMRHRVSLVIQSLLLTATQQLPNNRPLLDLTMPMLIGCTCQGYSLRLTGTRGLVGEGRVEGVVDGFGS